MSERTCGWFEQNWRGDLRISGVFSLHQYASQVRALTPNPRMPPIFQKWSQREHKGGEGVPERFEEAGFELKPLVNALEKYGRVAGTYCFAFLVYFTCHVITSLSVVLYTENESDGIDVLEHWLGLVWAGSVVALICVSGIIFQVR